jgi:hypothetical protein
MCQSNIIADEHKRLTDALNKINKFAKQFNFVCSTLKNQTERQFLYRGFELSPINEESNCFEDELFLNNEWHYGKWHIGYLLYSRNS